MRMTMLLMLLLLPGEALASDVRRAEPGTPPPPARIENLAWLAGHWEGEGLGGRSYETISPPLGGQMVGHFQQISGTRVQFYEFYQFVPHNGSILLRIKHFNHDLTGWEERADTVDFPLVAIGDWAVYFDGVTMLRTGSGGLRSIVRVGREGQEEEIEFTFRRVEN